MPDLNHDFHQKIAAKGHGDVIGICATFVLSSGLGVEIAVGGVSANKLVALTIKNSSA